jgi:phage/plasmid-associated DNA primase
MPKLNKPDGGIRRRMRRIPFPFQFVEKPKESHERLINIELKDKIAKSNEWRDEFLLMLLDSYKTIKGSLMTPESVMKETEDYFADNDPIRDWLSTYYDTKLDVAQKKFWLPAKDLLAHFAEVHPEQRMMTPATFKGLMEMNGVSQERKSNNFKCEIHNHDDDSWEMGERKAGSYYLGIRRIPTA